MKLLRWIEATKLVSWLRAQRPSRFWLGSHCTPIILLLLASACASAQTQYKEWVVNVVNPAAWKGSAVEAAYAYADWYCAAQSVPASYSNCTPDFVTPTDWPNYMTRLRLTAVSGGGTFYTAIANIISRTDPEPPNPNEDKQYGCDDRCLTTGDGVFGNPINAGTGNKVLVERDYTSTGDFPLEFVRYYNSKSPNKGTIGPKWRHTYERYVELVEVTQTTKFARVHRADGRVITYTLVGAIWQADADAVGKLIWSSDALGGPLSWAFVDARDMTENYDAKGRLVSATTRSGLTQTLVYDGQGRLASVSDSFGRQLQFGYDPQGRFSALSIPTVGSHQYGYTASGMHSSVTYPDSRQRQYIYNEPAHTMGTNQPTALTGVLDESATRYATYKYDASGRAVSSSHAGGAEQVDVAYNATGTSTVTSALGHARAYTYATVNGVQKISSATGAADLQQPAFALYSYDASGNVSSRTDSNTNVTSILSDTVRNLETSRTEAYGTPRARMITTAWHSTYRLPTSITEPGRTTAFTHDSAGNVLTRTVTDRTIVPNTSRAWTYTYNSFGQVQTTDGPRTDVADIATYSYYNCTSGFQCGQVNTITNALGHVTTYNTYNAHGQPLTITNPNGVVTTLAYDLRQRLTSRTVGSELTSFEYWPTGLLKKATLPDGSYLQYTYDAAHRLTGINDGDTNHIVYTLDAMGNRTKDETFDPTNALRQTRSRVFNTLNQLSQEIGAAGTPQVTTTFGYDNNGNQTSIAAPMTRNTGQTYDELNRLTTVTDPATGITTYGYDALDQLISVTDPKSLATTYSYNGLGDLKQQVSPDTDTTTNTYDSGGNLKTSTNARGIITTYTYDALDRIKSAAFKLGTTTDQTINYNYDAGTNGKGRLTSASDANHSMAWTYDAQGRVTGKSQVVGAVTHSVGYGYVNGQRTAVTTPSGQTITYGYTNNQITSIKVNGTFLISSVLYEPFGPPKQWTWGNGTQSSRTYDQDGKVTQITGPVTTTYGYDDAFRITGITDTANSALSWLYGYDSLDRLTSASKTGTTIGYTYDANGNRLSQTGTSASTYTIAANSNRVTATSGALSRTYGYNSDGNINSYTGISYTYNNRGRIKSSTKNSVTTNYTYNALGELVKKSTGMYFYDEAGHLLGQYTTSGALTSEIVWLGDTPVATIRPATGGGVEIFYIHTDHLNTPRVVTQPSNNAQRWRWDSNPFGGLANDNPSGLGAFTFELRFPGQIAVSESGLYYNYFRDYDYQTGRYVQSDPIGLAAGVNTYAYVELNPVSNIDPSGLICNGRWKPVAERFLEIPALGWGQWAHQVCRCHWMCIPCRGPWVYDDRLIESLPSTTGTTVVIQGGRKPANTGSGGIRPTTRGPAGGPSNAMGGTYRCMGCKPPDVTETGCNDGKCYSDSNFHN